MQDDSCSENPENFFEMAETYMGNCYRFNSGKNMSGDTIPILYSTTGGKDDSFRLILNNTTGLMMCIHDRYSPPVINYYNTYLGNGVFVSSATETQLVINKRITSKLGLPFNDCYKDVSTFRFNKTIVNYFLLSNVTYQQTNCLVLCFDVLINTNPCNCTNTSLGSVWNDCWIKKENAKLNECTFKYKLNFFKESVLNKCQQYCPLECDKLSYSVIGSSFLNNGSLTVSVFYESLTYSFISEIPKTYVVTLFANIGGVLSMFIGMSFVSIFEVIEILIEIILTLFKKNDKILVDSKPDKDREKNFKMIMESILDLENRIKQLENKQVIIENIS